MKQTKWVGLLLGCVAFALFGEAAAQDAQSGSALSAAELVKKLAPPEGAPDIEYEGVPERTWRGLAIQSNRAGSSDTTNDGREAGSSAALPAVTLDIQFRLDSAALTGEARDQLDEFAKALKADRLQAYRFLLEGHTDSRGSADYNQDLSQHRAAAVRDFLVRNHGIDRRRLATRGLGERFPLTGTDPRDGANRRVEITNIGRPNAADAGGGDGAGS